ncbi:class I tRNA ligase family protein, partial [Algoriphagus sp.]|uniref:class I tRNA ligase family protein n=1 Tax=Algoriphagus sp. TaxID=1872435 RepID=UPI0025F0B66E
GSEVEKMSKSKYNVVNPDDIIEKYGADTLRLYEMFLGPLEQFKPWNTNGIDGVFKFLRKLWNLYHTQSGEFQVSDAEPSKEEYKALHKAIKKMEEDMSSFSFNTSVSSFMICVNELSALKSNKRKILEPLAILVSPYAPHISEELWSLLGHQTSITEASFPVFDEKYLKESAFEYPVMINGKMRAKIKLDLSLSKDEIEKAALADEIVQKWLDGKAPKKMIIVPGKIVNVVI